MIHFTWNRSMCVTCNMLFPTLLVSLRKILFYILKSYYILNIKHALFFPRMTIQAICLTGQISSSMCLCLTGIFPTWQYVSTQLIFYHRLFWWKEEHKGKEEECKLRISLSVDFIFNPTLTCTYICWFANTPTLTCWGILASGYRADS